MAFCSKCGSELKEGMKFCSKCGLPVKVTEAARPTNPVNEAQETARPEKPANPTPAPARPEKPANPTPATAQYPYKNNYQEPAVTGIRKALKAFGGSALFLIYIIIAAAVIVLYVMKSGSAAVLVGFIIASLPAIFCVIGMLVGFINARSAAIPEGRGVGLYKAGKIIAIVYAAVIGVVSILVLVFGALMINKAASGSLDDILDQISDYTGINIPEILDKLGGLDTIASVVVIILIVIIAAVVLLYVLYEIGLIKSATAIRNSLRRGRQAGYVGIYPIVILILGAVCSVINAVNTAAFTTTAPELVEEVTQRFGLTNLDLSDLVSSTTGTTAVVSAVLVAAKYIIGAILLINLRSKMKEA